MNEDEDAPPSVDLRFGDCLAVLRELADESVSVVICDPPYGLADLKPAQIATAFTAWLNGDRDHVPDGRGFMGRAWDSFVPPPAVWDECLRVLKPGGHLAAFAGSRTYDLMGMSIRLAGFEIRDGLQWLYGSGMPKGQNVGKAIDKMAGAEREVTGTVERPAFAKGRGHGRDEFGSPVYLGINSAHEGTIDHAITAPATPEAARWEGWNTSLKPSQEPIVLARKPIRGTVAANVLAHGTGAINVDACRVESGDKLVRPWILRDDNEVLGKGLGAGTQTEPGGRWPSNILLTHAPECHEPGECVPGCPVAELDAQSGTLKSGYMKPETDRATRQGDAYGTFSARTATETYADSGGASRFFPSFRYQAKAPAAERPKIDGKGWPTVKPQGLMRWLVRLLTPPGGVVLDPFAGTSATLQAARDEGFASIGIERDEFAYLLSCRRLGLPELVPATVTDAETDEPVLLVAVEPEPTPADPVLAAIADASSYDELLALWREHRWDKDSAHNAAAAARRAELEGAAA